MSEPIYRSPAQAAEDQWLPITPAPTDRVGDRVDGLCGDGQNAWANVGPRKYLVEYPSWGLLSEPAQWRNLPYFYVSLDSEGCVPAA